LSGRPQKLKKRVHCRGVSKNHGLVSDLGSSVKPEEQPGGSDLGVEKGWSLVEKSQETDPNEC